MELKQRIHAFSTLGELMEKAANNEISERYPAISERFIAIIKDVSLTNAWFVEDFVRYSFQSIGASINKKKLEEWTSGYLLDLHNSIVSKKIAVVMAGNIPLVGFSDFLAVLISGNKIIIKESSKDNLIHELATALIEINNDFKELIRFEKGLLTNFDAVIATGSDNTKRYFEYYFAAYPSIIRGNRNSVAIIKGNETDEELKILADDVFLYFGLGCRSVSKIFLPTNYPIKRLFEAFDKYNSLLLNHSKYYNNYEYHKSIYLVNREPFFDSGSFMMKYDEKLTSPLSVIYLEEYTDFSDLKNLLESHKNHLQCVVCQDKDGEYVNFGKSQNPGLNDYADGVDVLKFLIDLKKAM